MQLGDLIRGDCIEIDWFDIYEDSIGNPANAKLARRKSMGYFWERRLDEDVPVVITTTTLDEGGPEQQGYCIYPESCVRAVKMVKRKRRKKAVKQEEKA